jgi:hypothetical protein
MVKHMQGGVGVFDPKTHAFSLVNIWQLDF